MELGIKDKVALVTGASSGLGFAVAEALAAEGARVAINSRSEEKLTRAAEVIKEKTGQLPLVVTGELGREGEAERIVGEITSHLGPVEILVANAGGPPAGAFADHDKATWRRASELTLHSAIDLTREVLPAMVERRWGRIVFITSIAVRQPIDGLIISNTLRAGLTGFAKTISNEYAVHGITVNTVCPGYTKTERLVNLARFEAEKSGASIDEIYQRWADMAPAKRLGKPDEPADLISFLVSERAAYISGTAIPVDGGLYKALL